MKPTHYFLNSTNETQPKNKLEKDFRQYLLDLEGTLIVLDELTILKKQILAKAEELNAIHKRCKPLNISFWETYKKSISISGFYCIQFLIEPATLKTISI